jgi:cobalt/nickel transport system permease protein
MHIPDGFISPPVAIISSVATTGLIALSLSKSRENMGLKQAPIMGLTTAFIFAGQMINFPVAGGTSGHLLGGTLAAIILGNPWSATLSIATVLLIQSLLFADGGITALGVNIFNMGIIGVWVGWILTKTLQRLLGGAKKRLPLAAGIGAGISVIVAAIACGIELIISQTATFNLVLPAMTGIHILIGVGEGLITGGILTYLIAIRPDLLPGDEPKLQKWLIPVIATLLIAGVLSLFASSFPDGLEKVAEDLGFIKLAENVRIDTPTPFADYKIQGIDEKLGTSISGIIGTIICFGFAFAIAKLSQQKNV